MPQGKLLLITSAHPLTVLPASASSSKPDHSPSQRPATWLLVRPYRPGLYLLRTPCRAKQLPRRCELVLGTVPPRAPLVTAPLPDPYWFLAAAAGNTGGILHGAHFTKRAVLWKSLINSLAAQVMSEALRLAAQTTELWSDDGGERVREICRCRGTFHPRRFFLSRQTTSHSPWAASPGMPQKALNRLTSHKREAGPQRGSRSRPKAGLAAQLAGREPAARCPSRAWSCSARPQHIACTAAARHRVFPGFPGFQDSTCIICTTTGGHKGLVCAVTGP